jgi:hypothetical protein
MLSFNVVVISLLISSRNACVRDSASAARSTAFSIFVAISGDTPITIGVVPGVDIVGVCITGVDGVTTLASASFSVALALFASLSLARFAASSNHRRALGYARYAAPTVAANRATAPTTPTPDDDDEVVATALPLAFHVSPPPPPPPARRNASSISSRVNPFPSKNPRFALASLEFFTLSCERNATAFNTSFSRMPARRPSRAVATMND